MSQLEDKQESFSTNQCCVFAPAGLKSDRIEGDANEVNNNAMTSAQLDRMEIRAPSAQ